MRTRPRGLPDSAVADTLAAGWGWSADAVEHLPVGFGSHHWRVEAGGERWFFTADDLEQTTLRRLAAALRSARALRDIGLDFVVAPVPTNAGDVVHAVGDRWAAAVYPHVEGRSFDWGPYREPGHRRGVLDRVVAIHAASDAARPHALVDDLEIPNRELLVDPLAAASGRWDTGPFGEATRALLVERAAVVERLVGRTDWLVAAARRRADRLVVTHGEPHPGNTLVTADGVVLVDWDTTLVAQPERDLWILADGDPAVLDVYADATGVEPLADMLELYRLWWDVTEIAVYVDLFRRPHEETADTVASWENLNRCLDAGR